MDSDVSIDNPDRSKLQAIRCSHDHEGYSCHHMHMISAARNHQFDLLPHDITEQKVRNYHDHAQVKSDSTKPLF